MPAVMALAAAFLIACNYGTETCGPSRCDGSKLVSCSLEGNDAGRLAVWSTTPCNGACVADATGVFCASSTAPIAECQRDGTICYQGAIGTCKAGYLEYTTPCATGTTCGSSAVCGPVCVRDPTPDPRCGPGPRPLTSTDPPNSYCDNGTAVACNCGFVDSSVDCDGANLCVASGSDARCVLSSMPDPRCGDPPPQSSSFCDRNSVTQCWMGYPVSTGLCPSGGAPFCVASGSEARCVYSPTQDPRCGAPSPQPASFCDANSAWRCWMGYVDDQQMCGTGTCAVTSLGASCEYPAKFGSVIDSPSKGMP